MTFFNIIAYLFFFFSQLLKDNDRLFTKKRTYAIHHVDKETCKVKFYFDKNPLCLLKNRLPDEEAGFFIADKDNAFLIFPGKCTLLYDIDKSDDKETDK